MSSYIYLCVQLHFGYWQLAKYLIYLSFLSKIVTDLTRISEHHEDIYIHGNKYT